MSDAGAALTAALEGIRFALQFNPLFAAVSAAAAAAIAGYPRAPRERVRSAAAVLTIGWLVGDGLRVLARARDLHDGVASIAWPESVSGAGAPSWAPWVLIAVWAAGTLAIGYVVPTFVGATVGRRVTHGTGWLAAAAIAAALALAISTIGGSIG